MRLEFAVLKIIIFVQLLRPRSLSLIWNVKENERRKKIRNAGGVFEVYLI